MVAPVCGSTSKNGSRLGLKVTAGTRHAAISAGAARAERRHFSPSKPILRTGTLEALLLVLRFVRTAMSGAAMWAIVVTRGRPHILPFFVAPVALVIVAEEVLLLHGKFSFLNARTSDRAHPRRIGQASP